ncbi:zinc ribbon domain-containing protein [Planctomycetota bacterium]
MASEFCQSCTAPLSMPDFKGVAENYCKYCTDEQGNLKSHEEIQNGIAMWFKGWHGDVSQEILMERAGHFMKGLPAWAER